MATKKGITVEIDEKRLVHLQNKEVPEEVLHKWCFPRLGVTVEAKSYEDALDKLAKMKKELKGN